MIKPALVLFLSVFLMSLPAMAAGGIYRDFIWGVSPSDVRDFEKAVFFKEEGDSLTYLEKKHGYMSTIRYDFIDNQLWRVRVDFEGLNNADPEEAFGYVMQEQADLTALYGEPSKEDLLWKDTLYKNYPQFWHRALRYGDLTIVTEWKREDALVRMEAFRNSDNPDYTLGYTIENPVVAAQLEAAKMQDAWKTP